MAKSTDNVKVTGEFHMKVYDNGVLIKEYTDKNLVVQNGLNHLAKLLGAISPNLAVTKIGFGEGTAAPDMANLNLTADTFFKAFDAVTYVPDGKIKFDWSLQAGEANGITITEFALCQTDEKIFARKTGATINKVNTITVAGYWTITMT